MIENERAILIEKFFEYDSTSYFQAISFTIPGLQNPRLANVTSSSFKVYVFEDKNMEFEIFEMIEGVTVTMDRPNPFDRVNIRTDSLVNKAVTTYRFRAEGVLNAQDGDVLEISFPD